MRRAEEEEEEEEGCDLWFPLPFLSPQTAEEEEEKPPNGALNLHSDVTTEGFLPPLHIL